MAFKATDQSVSSAYNRIKELASGFKAAADQEVTLMGSQYGADRILNRVFEGTKDYRNAIQNIVATTPTAALIDEAIREENDPTYNVVTEYNAMIDAMQAVIDEVIATFPNATFHEGFTGEDQTFQTFGPGQTATLRGLLEDASAAIE